MFRTLSLYLLSAALAFSASYGGTVLSTGQTTFNTTQWNGGQSLKADNNGSPWFDLTSVDGVECNAAYYIAGTASGCSTAGQPGGVDYLTGAKAGNANYAGPGGTAPGKGTDFWHGATGATYADLNFNFAPDSPAFTIQIMVEASSNNTLNEFGIWWIGADSLLHQARIFSGAEGPGASATFTAGSTNFGFYLDNGAQTYYTESSRNKVNATNASADISTQHFAIFRDPNTDPNYGSATSAWDRLWIAMEDANGSTSPSQRDWNDMIVLLSCVNCSAGPGAGEPGMIAPEPETHALIGIGLTLITLAQLRRRRH